MRILCGTFIWKYVCILLRVIIGNGRAFLKLEMALLGAGFRKLPQDLPVRREWRPFETQNLSNSSHCIESSGCQILHDWLGARKFECVNFGLVVICRSWVGCGVVCVGGARVHAGWMPVVRCNWSWAAQAEATSIISLMTFLIKKRKKKVAVFYLFSLLRLSFISYDPFSHLHNSVPGFGLPHLLMDFAHLSSRNSYHAGPLPITSKLVLFAYSVLWEFLVVRTFRNCNV